MYCPSVLMMPFGPAPYLKMLTVPELRVRPPRLEEFGNQSWCAPGEGAVPKMNPMMVPTAAGGRGQLCAGREEHKKEGARRVKGHILPPIRAPILTVPESAVVARVMCSFCLPVPPASRSKEGRKVHTLVEVGLPAAVVARRRRHCVSGKGGRFRVLGLAEGRKGACRSAVFRSYLAPSWSELSKCGQSSGLTDCGNIYWMMQLPMRLPWASAAGPAGRTGHMHSLELAASLPAKKGMLPSAWDTVRHTA